MGTMFVAGPSSGTGPPAADESAAADAPPAADESPGAGEPPPQPAKPINALPSRHVAAARFARDPNDCSSRFNAAYLSSHLSDLPGPASRRARTRPSVEARLAANMAGPHLIAVLLSGGAIRRGR